jgi:hypothetical protein
MAPVESAPPIQDSDTTQSQNFILACRADDANREGSASGWVPQTTSDCPQWWRSEAASTLRHKPASNPTLRAAPVRVELRSELFRYQEEDRDRCRRPRRRELTPARIAGPDQLASQPWRKARKLMRSHFLPDSKWLLIRAPAGY